MALRLSEGLGVALRREAMCLPSLPTKPGVPVLVPDNEDRDAFFVRAVDEKVWHLLKRVEPPAARGFGPEFGAVHNNLSYSRILVHELFRCYLPESTEVALQDFVEIALGFWVKRVFHPSFALSLARASSPGTNCTVPAAI